MAIISILPILQMSNTTNKSIRGKEDESILPILQISNTTNKSIRGKEDESILPIV